MSTKQQSQNPGNLPVQAGSALPVNVNAGFTTSIQAFNQPLANYLGEVGLPTTGILAPLEERRKVIDGLSSALEVLPYDERNRAAYLSRFTVAVSVGLFDGAVNYLWNETIAALRRLVNKVDLSYFFSVASQVNTQYSNFTATEDLEGVSEHDLLETCRRMGLLTDVNFKRLEHVNYMRNHASAAHPNDVEINGFELLGWLSNCLRHAITAEPETSVITIKRLLANVRNVTIPTPDYPLIGGEVARLSRPQIDDFLWTLYGMYTDVRMSAQARTNIDGIAKFAWEAASEDRKYEIGARYGLYRKNGEVDRTTLAADFLARVKGLQYRDEDSLAAELLARLQTLKTAHYGMNNFYNEWPHAQLLAGSLPVSGAVPRAARPTWVKVLAICYIGNGHGYRDGTDEAAIKYYQAHIGAFTDAEIAEFVHLFGDVEFNTVLDRSTPDQRARAMATILMARTQDVHLQRALNEIVVFPASLDKIHMSDAFKKLLANAPKRP